MNLLEEHLGQLARRIPGATRIFNQYQLDFCCGGEQRLGSALQGRGIDPQPVLDALTDLIHLPGGEQDWNQATRAELIDHILKRYHARHREQIPELVHLAQKVEQVHEANPHCPAGLADHLRDMGQELESHMLKEEQILFPVLRQAPSAAAFAAPISVMRFEHDQHGKALTRLAELTHDLELPVEACNTWRALYAGLRELRDDLMQHIHLENNILFSDSPEGNQ